MATRQYDSSRTAASHRPVHRARGGGRRPGYILLIVLGLTVVVTSLGLDFAQNNATVMPESANRLGGLRAEYAAESGVAMAAHYLMYPPTAVAYGGYWTGANNLAIDASADYANVAVQQDATDPNKYRIASTGVSIAPGGGVRGKFSVQVEAVAPLVGRWWIPHAYVSRGALTAPARMSVYGDLHANGAITCLLLAGWCNGKVTSTGLATWLGGGPPTAVQSGAAAVSVPAGTPANYGNYTINGKSYSAYSFGNNNIQALDATTMNAVDMSATNLGRIIMVKVGDAQLQGPYTLNGCLVVQGNLRIAASSITVNAAPGFPALVVTGDLEFSSASTSLTVNGPVICGGRVSDGARNGCALVVNGPAIFGGSPNLTLLGTSTMRFNADSTRSVFWDLETIPPTPKPITLLSWREN